MKKTTFVLLTAAVFLFITIPALAGDGMFREPIPALPLNGI